MTENMKNFLEKVSQDKALAEKICQMDKAELIGTAKELDFELTEEDFAAPDGELNEDEMEAVSGGGECKCFLGGGGTKAGNGVYPACGCVVAGVGEAWDGKYDRCYCALGGYGNA